MFNRKRRRSSLKHQVSPKKRQHSKHLFSYLSTLLIPAGILAIYFSPLLRVSQTICVQDSHECSDHNLSQLDRLSGNFILFLKPSQIKESLSENNPDAQDIQVNLSLPNTISVRISTNQDLLTLVLIDDPIIPVSNEASPSSESALFVPPPLAVTHPDLFRQSEPALISLTSSGVLLPVDTKPVIDAYLFTQQPVPDQKSLIYLHTLKKELDSGGLSPRKLWILHDEIYAQLNTDTYATIPATLDNPRAQVATLQQIITSTTINLNHAIIDLRFQNPVISYYQIN